MPESALAQGMRVMIGPSRQLPQLRAAMHALAAFSIVSAPIVMPTKLTLLALVFLLYLRLARAPCLGVPESLWTLRLPNSGAAEPHCLVVEGVDWATTWGVSVKLRAPQGSRWHLLWHDQMDEVTFKRLVRALRKERMRRFGESYRWLRWLRG